MTPTTVPPKVPQAATGAPIWVDLTAPRPQQARDFYAALFGWEYQTAQELGGYATAFSSGKKVAGLSPPPPGLAGSVPAQWTIYFDTKDIVDAAERVKALGGAAFEGPIQIGDQGQAQHFSDPSGTTFGLWQDDQHGGFLQSSGPGRLIWCEYNARDLPQALDFYVPLLHAASQQVPGLEYHTLHHQGNVFAGVAGMSKTWQAAGQKGWTAYFYAPDVDEMVRAAEQHGASVLVAPLDTRFGRKAMLSDPAGSVFTLMNPTPLNPRVPGG